MRPAAAAAALSLLLCARVATAAPSLLPGDPGHHGEHGAHGEHHGEHGAHGEHDPEHHAAHGDHGHADHGAAAVDRAGSAGRSISPGVLDFGSGIQVTPRKPGQVGHHNPFLPGYQPSFERRQATGSPQVSPQVAQQQRLQQQQPQQQQQQQPQQVFSPQPQRPFIPIRPEDLNQNPGTGRSGPKGPVTAGCGAGLVCVPEADCDPYTGFVRGALNRPPADPAQPTVAVQRCELGTSTGVCCQERPRPYVDPSVNTIDSQGSLRPDIRRPPPPASAVPAKTAPTFASKPRRPVSGARPNFAGNPFLSGLTPAAVPVSSVAPQRPALVPQRPAAVPQRPAPVPQQQAVIGAQTDRQVTCQADQRCVEVNVCGPDGYIANRAALGNTSPTLTTYCITPFNGRGVCCRPRPQEPPASASQPTQQQQRPAAQAQPQPQPQPLPQPQPQRPAAQANFQQQPQPQQPQPQQPRPQPQPLPQQPQPLQTQPPQPQRQPEAETGALSLPTQVSTPESSFEQSFLHLQKAAFQAALQPVPEQQPPPQSPPPPQPQPQQPQPQPLPQSRTQATAVNSADPNSTPESSFEQSLLQIQRAAFQQRRPEGPQQGAAAAASPTPAVCGRSGAIPVPGVTPAPGEAEFGELPWHAVIYYTNGTFVCGGTLIGERHVLTAAHCLSYIRPGEIQVRLGEYQLYSDREPLPHQDITVSVIHMNPGFREGPLFEDVAVLELTSPAQLAQNVQPICLPEAGQSFDGRRCIASGWGKQDFDAGAPSVLKKVELPIVRNEMCQSSLKTTSLGSFFQLHRSFICAGGETGVNACQGDGGGPLACLVDGSYVLAGVTSWSIECGHQDAPPAVFASVTEVLDFILESTGAAPAASGSETSIRRANRPDRNASYGR